MTVQHDPERQVIVNPKTIKTLSNGTKIVTYVWYGAELAEIMSEKIIMITPAWQ